MMIDHVVLRVIEESVMLQQRILERSALDGINLHVGRDSAASIHGASAIGEFDLAEVNGKDETKINKPETLAARRVDPAMFPNAIMDKILRAKKPLAGHLFVWEETEVESSDHSRLWLVENQKKGRAELWRTHELTRIIRTGEVRRMQGCEVAYSHMGSSHEYAYGLVYIAAAEAWAQLRLQELKGLRNDVGDFDPPEDVIDDAKLPDLPWGRANRHEMLRLIIAAGMAPTLQSAEPAAPAIEPNVRLLVQEAAAPAAENSEPTAELWEHLNDELDRWTTASPKILSCAIDDALRLKPPHGFNTQGLIIRLERVSELFSDLIKNLKGTGA
jgi:hypothetical protein